MRSLPGRYRSWVVALWIVLVSGWGAAQETPPAAAPEAAPAPETPAPAEGAPADGAEPAQPMAPSAKVENDLPLSADMQVPEPAQLINGPLRDWVILMSDRVLVVESLAPRPGTIDKQIQRFEEKKREKIGKEGAELEAIEEEMVNLNYLYVTVPGEKNSPEYRIPLKQIREIVHHEDLMLRRMKMLAEAGQIDVALEFLNWMLENVPDWPGLAEQRGFLLMSDAKIRMDAGRLEDALVPLEELYYLQKDFPGVSEQIGNILQTLALGAAEKEDYPQAHHHLERLRALYPENPSVANISNGLEQRAQEMLTKAEEAYKAGRFAEAPDSAETAVAMWPKLKNLKARHKPIVERYQRMHVGVVRLTGEPVAYPIPSDAELREENLRHLPLFSLDRMQGGTAQYRTRYFNEWEPMDLGKRMRFELKQNRQPWETQPLLDAPTVVAMLTDRANPEHAEFDERIAGLIRSIEVTSPTEFTITFERVPSRLEAIFASILPPDDLEESSSGFRIAESDAEHTVFRRARQEPTGLQQYHLAEIVEHKFPSFDRVVQSLLRGEISMAPNLPDWHVRRLQADDKVTKDFFILPYAVPTTHLVLYHPDSPAGKSRELRRALSYGIDREKLLKETILRDPNSAHGRLIDSPFPKQSYGNSLQAKPLKYDLSAALAMSVAAARSLGEKSGEVPKLRMVAPPTLTERAAAQVMIRSWKRIGIEVELVPDDEGPQAKYDLIYRVGILPEPVVDWWPIVTLNRRATLADLAKKPDWLRQQLIELDRSSDWGRVVTQSQELHRRLSIDATYLPLFEVNSFMVVRKNARGLSPRPMHCYDAIEGWILDAWIPGEGNK
jgi:tetratricopeptide (TPR) repeat protein